MNYNEYLDKVQWLNDRTKEYELGQSVVSDKTWDDVYFEVQEYEIDHPDKISLWSPTQTIHFEIDELKKVKHNHPMLSLNKTKDLDEIKSFVNGHEYLAMAKMDGLTCSLTYEGGKLVRAETRGNGEVGEDITHNAMVIPSIPKRIRNREHLTVDGEIICTYKNFEAWSNEYKNPRNFAAGSIRLLDAKECAKRKLTFVAWDCSSILFYKEKEIPHRYLGIKIARLKEFGFTVVPFASDVYETIEDKIDFIKETCKQEGYPIDGIVFKYDVIEEYDAAGRTDHHFKGGLAYKFYDEEYETRLKNIHYDVSRNGVLTPVAVFEPIDIDGSTVERASLHNISVMHEILGEKPFQGQKLKVAKMNMIIPQIVWAEREKNVVKKD